MDKKGLLAYLSARLASMASECTAGRAKRKDVQPYEDGNPRAAAWARGQALAEIEGRIGQRLRMTKEQETSMVKIEDDVVCKLIRERLEHVNLIFELRHHFNDRKLVKSVGDSGWNHPWIYFDASMNYLLLTCFDLLGQPAEWVPFSEWLNSSKKTAERKAAVDTIPSNASPVEITKNLNNEYQSIYGVKTSFNNFILNILTQAERVELFFSIKINKLKKVDDPGMPHTALDDINDEKKKRDFLYSIRNKFTHSAVTMGSPAAGIFPKMYDPVEIDGKMMKGYIGIYHEDKNDESLSYSVRDWPFVLKRLIESALERREILSKT